MFTLILPLLLSQVPLAKGFAPNPTEHAVKQGDAVSLEGFATCAGAPSGAVVSKDPVLTLDVGEGLSHLAFQLGERGVWLVARNAAKELSCSKDAVLVLDAKPGKLELFLVTTGAAVESREVKLKVLDLDGVRELPLNIKRIKGVPVSLEGDFTADVPAAQLELSSAVEGLEWKLGGNATEVWLTSLMKAGEKPVKAPASLPAGKYAVWIRGSKGAYTLKAATATAQAAPAAAPAPAPTPAPAPAPAHEEQAAAAPAPASTPAPAPAPSADAFHVVAGVDIESLKGWSRDAQAARKQAFMELPANQFVFAAADGEALLIISLEGKQASVLSADGAEQSMALDELSLKPGSGPRVRAASLPDDLDLEALTTDKDPKFKAFDKRRKWVEACVERVKTSLADDEEKDAEFEAGKRCSVAKLEKAKKSLESDLRKAFKKKHATDLSQIERRLKTLFTGQTEMGRRSTSGRLQRRG
jgi:hypothetical protein